MKIARMTIISEGAGCRDREGACMPDLFTSRFKNFSIAGKARGEPPKNFTQY